MSLRVFKRYNQNANNRLKYKYHKTTNPLVTLDKYCQEGKHDPKSEGRLKMEALNEKKEETALLKRMANIQDHKIDEQTDEDESDAERDSEKRKQTNTISTPGKIEQTKLTLQKVQFKTKLIESDLKNIGIENMLRLWISQLVENCHDQYADNIEVRFYRKGLNGFDIICDGEGIPDGELPYICNCMEQRERNELYKSRSIGYRGEALNSLAKSSSLTVLTKHRDSEFAWKVQYGITGDISNIEQYDIMKKEGTVIQVRDVHKNNAEHKKKFFMSLNTAYESTIQYLNSWSYMSYDRVLVVSQALKEFDANQGNQLELWRTIKSGDFMTNVKHILKYQFRNTFPNMCESVIEWEHTLIPDMVKMRCIMLRPGHHKSTVLIKKCLHIFMNGRPAHATQRFHACFYDLYRDFKIPHQTIPFVILDIRAKEDAFDIKIQSDMRKFYFKPQYEKRSYELMRTYMWSLFNKLVMDTTFDPEIKPGMNSKVFKVKEGEHKIDKKTYRIAKPDIEHVENDDMDTGDLTSESDDEHIKEQNFKDMQTDSRYKNDPFMKHDRGERKEMKEIKAKIESGAYGDVDHLDFAYHKVSKEDKKQKQFDVKIGDLLSNFKKLREDKTGNGSLKDENQTTKSKSPYFPKKDNVSPISISSNSNTATGSSSSGTGTSTSGNGTSSTSYTTPSKSVVATTTLASQNSEQGQLNIEQNYGEDELEQQDS